MFKQYFIDKNEKDYIVGLAYFLFSFIKDNKQQYD
jgi:hypothetical protein